MLEKQEIPPHSQSIIGVKSSNNLPVNVTGFSQGGRHITSLGIMVANTVSVVLDNNCLNVLEMNVTDEAITLYRNTKGWDFNFN